MIAAAGDPRQRAAAAASTASLQRLGERLATDPSCSARSTTGSSAASATSSTHYRSEVSDLIATTVERWDADDARRRKMELQVGRDLQFIRINGTIVGGLAGIVIHAVGNALG